MDRSLLVTIFPLKIVETICKMTGGKSSVDFDLREHPVFSLLDLHEHLAELMKLGERHGIILESLVRETIVPPLKLLALIRSMRTAAFPLHLRSVKFSSG